MAALLQLPIKTDHRERPFSAELWTLLNRLRFQASTCRAGAYLDIYHACALLDPTAEEAEEAHFSVLLRVLEQALDSKPVFYRPGETDRTFDERWLVSLIDARMRNDKSSFGFLIHRRVTMPKRRIVAALVNGLTDILTKSQV